MLASKTDLGSLKTKVDNLDVGKLKTVSADLRKLSIVVDNDVKKLCMLNWLSQSMLLILGYQVLADSSSKHIMIRANKVMRRGF